MPTQIKEHIWTEFKMTSVQAVFNTETGAIDFVPDPCSESVITYGCSVCNMGAGEAAQSECPGFDLFEELDETVI